MPHPLNRRTWQIAVITLLFVAVYVGIRNVPVKQCNFLHYRDYLGKDGAIEECSIGETDFFNLEDLRYPVKIDLTASAPVVAGVRTEFTLRLANSMGNPIPAEELAINHTERLHLLIVDDSLSDYQHLHPVATGIPGEFTFTMAPVHGGRYSVYYDFIPLKSGRRTLAVTTFTAGGPHAGDYTAQPHSTTNVETALDGIRYTLTLMSTPNAPRGANASLDIQLSASRPEPIIYEPVMGAYAHVVAFAPGRSGFAHLHPLNPFLAKQDPRAPDLSFRFSPGTSGNYRLWAQVKIDGRERFVPFDVTL
ncbi:MAG: hypothetical protein SFY80_11030 [Verrucomicrobiota bacterium]|nr:hypothetical protein [Verrucomicrobiota bacterium]